MIAPESCTYDGYLYRSGEFAGERLEESGRRRQFGRMETLLRALARGFSGRLVVECQMSCPEGGTMLTAAWREHPYEPLRLTEAVYRLPRRIQSRLMRMQEESLAAELEG